MATLFRRLLDRPAKASPTSKLRLEHLEARDVPATITVTDLGDTIAVDGEVTLREALNSLNNATAANADVVPVGAFGTNDTVLFQAGLTGTITLTGNSLYLNVPATITGPGATVITVSGDDASRILYIGLDTAGGTVTISGLTFLDGDAQNSSGGAIFNDDAALVLTDMVFESNTTGNSDGDGGALYHNGPSLSITNGTFTNNFAYYDGGAILLIRGTLTISGSTFGTAGNGNTTRFGDGGAIAISNTSGATITNSTFTENYAYDEGGAISIDQGSLTISGSSFTNNEAGNGDGGAISGENFGTLIIDGSDFTGNQAGDDGGALGMEEFFVTITNSSFTNNSSNEVGGAIFLYEGRFTLDNVTISNNTAGGGGGGAFLEDVSGRIVNSTISGNESDQQGGGLYLEDVKSVTIERTVITGNTANANDGTNGGGGIYLYGVVTIIDSIISNNSAAYGAGISSFNASTLTIRGSTISGNTATGALPDPTASFSGGGGGIFLYNADLLIENSTISGNTAVTNEFYGGAGIALYGGTATIRNTTIAFNTLTGAGTGSGLFVSGSEALPGIVNLENTLIGSNTGGPDLGFGDAASGDPTDANFTITATNSLIEDPGAGTNLTLVSSITGVDPLLGALANNGGFQAGDLANLVTIQTHALLAGSPAIGGGSNSFVTNIANDQRGTGFTRIIGANVDIGSFEASTKAVPVNNVFAAGPGAQNGNGGGTIVAYNADGSVKATINAFPGFTGGVRVVTADVTGDGVDDYIVGAGPGGSATVKVFDGSTNAEIVAFDAYPAFSGGVYVAAGDFDKDGFAEVVVSPDQGGAPLVTVFDGQDLSAGTVTQLIQFLGIDDNTFFGGARIAVGDVNGDGIPDIAVAAGFLGGPRISVWSGATVVAGTPPTLLANFFAFESTLRNGAFVTLGDINGDGFADLILGGGPGGGPRVRIADGKGVLIAFNDNLLPDLDQRLDLQLGNFFAGDPESRGGVRLGVADLDGDGVTDIITGSGDGQAATVTVYAGSSITPTGTPPALLNLTPFPELTNGVFVG